jgi:hypothetical protein
VRYVVSLSGGTASAVAADRAITRYGRENVHLWFADTRAEDGDLHRFTADCLRRWGGELETFSDGRTPLEVAEDGHVIPNQMLAPCAFRLKIEPFTRWCERQPKPLTVLVGMTWAEGDRMKTPRARYEAIEGVSVDFPWLWRPLEYRPASEVVRSWGIEPPRLYALGFPHNNCGGACVKQGQGEWLRLLRHFPERFWAVSDWEQRMRAKGGKWADRAILRDRAGGDTKPLTLAELATRGAPAPGAAVQDDLFSCFCGDGATEVRG